MLGPDPGQLIAASEWGGQRRSCGNWLCGVQPRGRSQRVVSVHQGQLWGKALLHKAPCVSWHANLSSSQGTGVFFFSFFKEQFRIGFFFPSGSLLFPILLPFLSSKQATSRRTARHASLQASGTRRKIQQDSWNGLCPPGHPSLQILVEKPHSQFVLGWSLLGNKGLTHSAENPCIDGLFWCCSDKSCYGHSM